MDIDLARSFLAVVETGSFFEAANRLHVTQSTMSSRIKKLEDLLQTALFERSKSGASLTSAGLQFQKHAVALVRVWEHARLDVGRAEAHRDHLAVGSLVSIWDGFLLHWVAWMRENIPDIAITGTFGPQLQLMDRLAEGTLDIAVLYRPAQRPGLVVEHLFDEELVLVTSGDPDIKRPGKEYVLVNWGPEFTADHALAFPDLKQPALYLDLGTLGVNYLLDKNASGYYPIRAARPHLESGELKLVTRAPRFVYPAYVVYPEERDEAAYDPILEGIRTIASKI